MFFLNGASRFRRGVSQDTGGGRLAKKSDREVGGSRILD